MDKFYRVLLKKSWEILKRYKFLWFFGIFAAIMGNGGEIQILLRTSDIVPNLPTNLEGWREFLAVYSPTDVMNNIALAFRTQPSVAIPIFLLIVVLLLFLLWLVMVSQASLVHSIARIQANKSVDFRTTLSAGKKKFWPVFLLNFLTRFILYGSLVILALPFSVLVLLNSESAVGMFGVVLLSFLIAVPIAMIVNFVLKYAIAYVVIDHCGPMDAFLKAVRMFWRNWLVSLEMAVILFAINIAVGIGLVIALFFLVVPFLAAAVLFAYVQSAVLLNAALIIGIISFFALTIIVGAWLATFQFSNWTLLFLELKKGKGYSKLMRLAAKSSLK